MSTSISAAQLSIISSADNATTSAIVRSIRATTLVADIETPDEDALALEDTEIVVRFIAARGDRGARRRLRTLAARYNHGQPPGLRLVDELDAIAARFDQAACHPCT
jgi:hypothetical protein